MGYHRAGFKVIGVDKNPQPNYPFEFIRADALEYLAEFGTRYDAHHASPPCQGYLNLTKANRSMGRPTAHAQLIGETRMLLKATSKPYVIENVQDARAELLDPVRVCGTGLGLPLRRHRLFESSIPIVGMPCHHERYTEPKYWTGWRPKGQVRLSTVVQVYGNAGGRDQWPAAMGIDWMTPREMCEAIPPAYSEFVGRQIINQL